MGVPEEFIRYYESREGIVGTMVLSDERFEEVWATERRVKTQTLSEYDNIGFEELSKRRNRICIFMDDRFVFRKHSLLKMLDSRDNVIGTSVPEEDMETYRARDDVIWISKDFVMFMNEEAFGQERFVLYPYEFPELSDEIEGCLNAVGTSPAPSSDILLKTMAGMPLNTRLYTFILGFDCRWPAHRSWAP